MIRWGVIVVVLLATPGLASLQVGDETQTDLVREACLHGLDEAPCVAWKRDRVLGSGSSKLLPVWSDSLDDGRLLAVLEDRPGRWADEMALVAVDSATGNVDLLLDLRATFGSKAVPQAIDRWHDIVFLAHVDSYAGTPARVLAYNVSSASIAWSWQDSSVTQFLMRFDHAAGQVKLVFSEGFETIVTTLNATTGLAVDSTIIDKRGAFDVFAHDGYTIFLTQEYWTEPYTHRLVTLEVFAENGQRILAAKEELPPYGRIVAEQLVFDAPHQRIAFPVQNWWSDIMDVRVIEYEIQKPEPPSGKVWVCTTHSGSNESKALPPPAAAAYIRNGASAGLCVEDYITSSQSQTIVWHPTQSGVGSGPRGIQRMHLLADSVLLVGNHGTAADLVGGNYPSRATLFELRSGTPIWSRGAHELSDVWDIRSTHVANNHLAIAGASQVPSDGPLDEQRRVDGIVFFSLEDGTTSAGWEMEYAPRNVVASSAGVYSFTPQSADDEQFRLHLYPSPIHATGIQCSIDPVTMQPSC